MPYQGDMLIPWRVPFFPRTHCKKTNVLFPGSQKQLKPNCPLLVGGFNPSEKYQSNWIISPGRGENKKHLKPPNSLELLIINPILP